nr:hypothetical protein [Microbacterium testaceum]
MHDGDHGVVLQPEKFVILMRGLGADDKWVDVAREAVLDWAMTSPLSTVVGILAGG